ncbi:MAG TPA: alpha/beta hydrolase [Actinomycetota bacterium]|jgi:acetyl esterase/lipase|nr:alpha/beta hydrolase [Actinomycetota bacterium]
MPTAFLATALVGLAFILNARRALRAQLVLVPAFFASWLTIELAPQLLVADVVGAAVFVLLGGLDEWHGWIALGVCAFNGFLLWGIVREAYRAESVLDDALTPVIGAAARTPVGWREFAFPFKLWTRRIRRVRDVPYSDKRGRRHRLDVWHERESRTGRPCLLYVPGGAWLVGISNKNQQGKPLLIEMASRGWVCFSMNYPLSPRSKFPDHIVAVKRAIAWIREHAHEYGGDPSFLMVSGNSAGGHLSMLAALTANDPSFQPGFESADTAVQAAAPLYGVYDFTATIAGELKGGRRRHKLGSLRFFERAVVGRRLADDRPFFESISPWHRVGPEAPPFFVIHGSMDTLSIVEEARGFVARLREVSNEPVIFAELPRTQHAFDQFLSIRTLYTVRAIARFGEWAYERRTTGVRRGRSPGRARRSPTSRR